MGKNKLKRFAENIIFPNFFQPTIEEVQNVFPLKGKWGETYFNNSNPITLELGCGKGEYTVGLAKKYPSRNFIGVDRKGARMWRGAKTSVEDNLTNVAFLRTRIELLSKCFDKNEINEIWITFPDPQSKLKKTNRRLTSPYFLEMYRPMLQSEGLIHLKTDNSGLYQFTLKTIKEYDHQLVYETNDLYGEGIDDEVKEFQTFYEKMFLKEGEKIKYIKFRLNYKPK